MEHGDGPLLVLAGAGSGKTRVITARVARLIRQGVDPARILAVTFTNKAAAEMRERIGRQVGAGVAKALWLSTFHSFGVRFVRHESKAMGLGKRFTIFDQGDSLGVIRDVLVSEGVTERRLDAQSILSRISLWKNAMRSPSAIRPKDDEYDQAAAAVYGSYEERLVAMHAVDFDDLVVRPVQLLEERPAIRRRWRQRFDHILVDEFQDTNEAQLALVRSLANERGNVCVVGDDDQAIYGWRGAKVDNILDFESHFPGARVVKLEQNYRSSPSILNVANAAIEQSPNRPYAKSLRTARGEGDPVRLCAFPEPQQEAEFVAKEIQTRLKAGADPGGVAVLYRSNTQAKRIEEELRVAGIPYRVFGGTRFFDRKQVKDGVAYLRVAMNPQDELSLRRIVNTPARGLGAQSVARVSEYGDREGVGLLQSLRHADDIDSLPARAKRSATELASALDRASHGFRRGSFYEPAKALFESVGLSHEEGNAEEIKRTREQLGFLLESIGRVEARSGSDRDALLHLLHHMTLEQAEDDVTSSGREVTLSSLHSAKGLEFDVVFLVGCVEGVLPHSRVTDPKVNDAVEGDLEEERRLFYVGVTRARHVLYLTRSKERVHRGRLVKLTPSRFLEGLPEADVAEYAREESRELERHEVADMAKALLERLSSGG